MPPIDPSTPHAWLLGRERAQRIRLSQQLFATVLVLASALVLFYVGTQAGAPMAWLGTWLLLSLVWQLLVYGLIRSGWSQHLADPSLTRLQMAGGFAQAASAYPLIGEQRELVLPTMVLILIFGMFRGQARDAARMAWVALLMLVAAMLFAGTVWPLQASLRTELGILLMALIVLPGAAVLTGRIADIRERLSQQRRELNEALAHIERLATHDALTGLVNRRHADERLREALRRVVRGNTRLCIALLDIDHFKRFNDQYGHAVGDTVLRCFAGTAEACLRETDLLARWGGEEFLLLLEGSDLDAAATALQRLHAVVAQAQVSVDGQTLGFAFSAGLTQARPEESAEAVLERVDRALYRAKQQGRNCTVPV